MKYVEYSMIYLFQQSKIIYIATTSDTTLQYI